LAPTIAVFSGNSASKNNGRNTSNHIVPLTELRLGAAR
jgi:hypothetical protein